MIKKTLLNSKNWSLEHSIKILNKTFSSLIFSLTAPATLQIIAGEFVDHNIFPTIFAILYGFCGWVIWSSDSFPRLKLIKNLYVIQLILSLIWIPLVFHRPDWAEFVVIPSIINIILVTVLTIINIAVLVMIYLAYPKLKWVSLLLILYSLQMLFWDYIICEMMLKDCSISMTKNS